MDLQYFQNLNIGVLEEGLGNGGSFLQLAVSSVVHENSEGARVLPAFYIRFPCQSPNLIICNCHTLVLKVNVVTQLRLRSRQCHRLHGRLCTYSGLEIVGLQSSFQDLM